MSTETSAPIPHLKRIQQSFLPSSQYLLPADEEEKARLALQYSVLKIAFGKQVIFPYVDIKAKDEVLDNATGSACWLVDCRALLPDSVTIYATDIESRLFPTSPIVNIHFKLVSLLNLPQEWSNKFTLVNQRLLMAALTVPEWRQSVNEIFRVLKPGGWVQMVEGPSAWEAGPVSAKHQAMTQLLFDYRGLMLDCGSKLPTMLQEAGFINIYTQEVPIPLGNWAGQYGTDSRINFHGVLKAMKTGVLDAGGFGIVSSETEFDTLMDAMAQEWDNTPGTAIKFYLSYAQKPFVDI